MRKEELRALVRTMYDMQDMRIRMSNREMLKADGTSQDDNGTKRPRSRDAKVQNYIGSAFEKSHGAEEDLRKAIAQELGNYPIYETFLKDVKGCGPLMSAAIICEIDIAKAPNRSCLYQFAGLNPGMVQGRKMIDGKIVKVDELVRGDKKTKGFVAPYNAWLKMKLVEVLAGCMIKARSEYTKFYYDYKARLEQEEGWKDRTPAHRDRAAKRYMIKMFLSDLYEHWRPLEGLEVRCPYEEEYLGRVHHEKVSNG